MLYMITVMWIWICLWPLLFVSVSWKTVFCEKWKLRKVTDKMVTWWEIYRRVFAVMKVSISCPLARLALLTSNGYWKICAVHRYVKRPKSLIVNVSRHVYYEKITNVDNKRLHFFKWFVNFILNIFAVRENSKFQLFGAAVSKIYSETVATK